MALAAALAAGGILLLIVGVIAIAGQHTAPVSPQRMYGTLESDVAHRSSDYRAGFRASEVDVSWAQYEPAEGYFDSDYTAHLQRQVRTLRDSGFAVSISTGLATSTPSWVLRLPNARLLDQYGHRAGLNLQWSAAVRSKAEAYLTRLVKDLGPQGLYSIRIGTAPDAGELLYPASSPRINALWAFDPDAQYGGQDLAAGATPSPFPGWRPGQKEYRGEPFTVRQVEEWYRWYVDSLADTGNWEVATLEAAGYRNWFAWLLPSDGEKPRQYSAYVDSYLTASTWSGDPAPRGGVWDIVIGDIRDKAHAQIQNTGLGDGTGGNSACQPADRSAGVRDPEIDGWSGGRWTSYLADLYGMHKSGENAGPHDSLATVQAANAIFLACGMDVWYFAFDFSLHDGHPGAAQLSDMARIIRSSAGG